MSDGVIDGASEGEIGNPVTNSNRVPKIDIGKIALGKWQHILDYIACVLQPVYKNEGL